MPLRALQSPLLVESVEFVDCLHGVGFAFGWPNEKGAGMVVDECTYEPITFSALVEWPGDVAVPKFAR